MAGPNMESQEFGPGVQKLQFQQASLHQLVHSAVTVQIFLC
jgi:hypothetical protein